MDKDMDCYTKMIARLDLRINQLMKMRKDITCDMMYLIISEDSKKIILDKQSDPKQINNVYNSKQ